MYRQQLLQLTGPHGVQAVAAHPDHGRELLRRPWFLAALAIPDSPVLAAQVIFDHVSEFVIHFDLLIR